jgi:hypothetical protein
MAVTADRTSNWEVESSSARSGWASGMRMRTRWKKAATVKPSER